MTQKEKDLLLKDLSARLFYGVKVWNSEFLDPIEECYPNETLTISDIDYYIKESIEVKPYLRPMSSMTEDEKKEFHNLIFGIGPYHNENLIRYSMNVTDKNGQKQELCIRGGGADTDWLNAHHFDYRGLIGKGLALEAPEDMYKIED